MDKLTRKYLIGAAAIITAGKVSEVVVGRQSIRVRVAGADHTVVRVDDSDLYRELTAHGVKVTGSPEAAPWIAILSWILPVVVILALGRLMLRRTGPTEDRFVMTEGELAAKIAVLLGGRAAEQIVFGDLSTGAENDLQKATEIARAMVRAYGMSPRLGAANLDGAKRATLLGAASELTSRDFSEQTAVAIDEEVRRILDEQERRARSCLQGRRRLLGDAAERLLIRETLLGDELREMVAAVGQPAAAAA